MMTCGWGYEIWATNDNGLGCFSLVLYGLVFTWTLLSLIVLGFERALKRQIWLKLLYPFLVLFFLIKGGLWKVTVG